jgi:hypothetical protein
LPSAKIKLDEDALALASDGPRNSKQLGFLSDDGVGEGL